MKQKFGCLSIFITLLLVVSLLLNLVLIGVHQIKKNASDKSPQAFKEELITGDNDATQKIALIDLSGVISSEGRGQFGDNMVEDIHQQLDAALKDAAVHAIILRIDSPGGEVTASDIIYHEVSKARAKKPIVVYMQSVAASGGYYSAMGGSYLLASETTITGSIGVIMEAYNYMDLLTKIGVKAITFKSGKMKDLLNPARPMAPEEQAFVQSLIDETYSKFVGVVARERKLDETMLRQNIADGRIFSGKQALDNKLIDGLGYFEDAVSKAQELGKCSGAKVIRYQPPFDWGHLLGELAASHMGPVKVQVQVAPINLELSAGKFYYLCPLMLGK